MEGTGREISFWSLTVAGWLMVGLFEAQGLSSRPYSLQEQENSFC